MVVDLLLGVAAVALLLAALTALFRSERPGRSRIAALVALVVLAAGVLLAAIFHRLSAADEQELLPELPIASTRPATQGLGTAIMRIQIPMGTGDKLPQGAIWLDPPRAGTDAYTGDLSLLCSTPGKADHDQNCTGADQRVWTVEPLAKRAVIAPAGGDAFADPAACAVAYQPGYLELAAGASYCARVGSRTFALRVPSFPADQPLPAALTVEVAVLG